MKYKALSLLISVVFCITTANSFASSQKSNGFAQTIARDLVGQVISDPARTYFPEEWRWELKRGEVLSVEIKKSKQKNTQYAAIIFAYLRRGHLRVNAKMLVQYHYNGKKWVLTGTKVRMLNIPKQKDYSQYVRLYMDYDFLPTLMLKNKCDMDLFVRVKLLDNSGEIIYQSHIVEAFGETPVCIGAINEYTIIYAYLK